MKKLQREDGASIAYEHSPGKGPGVVFLCGFKSDMTGEKALALEGFCRRRGQAFLRFDYTGHGASSGAFTDGTIGAWTEDAIFVLDELTKAEQILVGSSMGGWLMVLVALARPERIGGLLGIASAPDFTEGLIWNGLKAEMREKLHTDGVIHQVTVYGDEPTPITKALIEDGRRHLVLQQPIGLTCPVRLLHGMADTDVPWRLSVTLAEKLAAEDVVVSLIKDAEHRLSRASDIERILGAVAELSEKA
ncbi:MAG: alpha/beta hydrolase [Proteobacteria bacterium]|nr:alpha/beta hydrolase [Pseudomonadota bacterium]